MSYCWLVFTEIIRYIFKTYFLGKYKNSAELVLLCDYLQIENSRVILKKKHPYYGQVQIGMAVLDLKTCDFIVYSKCSKSFVNIIVPFDELFALDLLKKLQNIYFLNMLHEICLHKEEYCSSN